jgi:hypothetical protein
MGSVSFAQDATVQETGSLGPDSNLKAKKPPLEKSGIDKFSGMLLGTYQQNLYTVNNSAAQTSDSYNTLLSYAATPRLNVGVSAGYQDNLKDSSVIAGNGFSDTNISLGLTPYKLDSWNFISAKVSDTLPSSKYSSQYQQLQDAVGADIAWALKPTKWFNFLVTAGVTRYFHEYTTDLGGSVLNPYVFREGGSILFSWKNLSLRGSLTHLSGLSYNDDFSETYEHTEELSLLLQSHYLVAIGHTNANTWLGPDGLNSNLKLIDQDASQFYGTLGLVF